MISVSVKVVDLMSYREADGMTGLSAQSRHKWRRKNRATSQQRAAQLGGGLVV